MNVLSLFDGMSCGQIALNRIGIKYDNYYSSEIDKFAIAVTQHNYPNTIQLGDINNWPDWRLPKIDLIMGGSPCQGFSFAGKQLNFSDSRSKLFFKFVEVLECYKSKYFLLENVRMKKEYQNVITEILGVEPILINSALVSAQNRNRLYWTNIPNVNQPEDKRIILKNILERNIEDRYFYSQRAINYLDRSKINKRFVVYADDIKSNCLVAVFNKSIPYNVYVDREKSYCLTGNYANMACINYEKGQGQIVFHNDKIRRLTPIECERLQTVPDNYTLVSWKNREMSNSQRYKMLGNGWTVDVIVYILKEMVFNTWKRRKK